MRTSEAVEEDLDVTFTVPVEPRGKAGRGTRVIPAKGSRPAFAHSYKDTATTTFEGTVATTAATHLPPGQIDGPVRLDMLVVVPRPKYMLKVWKRGPDAGKPKHGAGLVWAPKKPDRDNTFIDPCAASC